MQKIIPLPIDNYLDEISKDCLNHSTLLVKASPGSGKTTRLPWSLTKVIEGKVIVLEPRRIAAKLAAERIASENGLTLGQQVGHHFRFDKKVSSETKLIFYTEGTFLKQVLHDPDLKEVDLVILDEFHERHLDTDLSLAYLRTLQKRRPNLKIILMSATIDKDLLSAFQDAKLIEIEAKRFHVEINYLPNQPSVLAQTLEQKIKNAIKASSTDGDVLVFLPGMREILRTQNYLGDELGEVFVLHSEISAQEQELALSPCTRRKIILSTNIAESSITIPGIKVVIDSGIQRESHYSPWHGLKLVEDQPITQSSAIQRAGRAGRTSDGECFRLYSEFDFKQRAPFTLAEILRADLTDTFLFSKQLKRPLHWFTAPPTDRWEKARELAHKIGAIDSDEQLTSIGEELLKFPLGARLSRSLVAGKDLVLPEKSKLLRYISEVIEKDRHGVLFRRLQFFLKDGTSPLPWEKSLLSGFIDQTAKFRSKQRDFIHYSGKILKAHHSLKDLHDGLYLILDITQAQEAMSVLPIKEEWIYEIAPFPLSEEVQIQIDEKFHFSVMTKLGSIVLEETSYTPKFSSEIVEKVALAGRNLFSKKWQQWKESEDYLRLHFWSRVNTLSLDDIEQDITLKDYLITYEVLSWEYLEEYFFTKIQDGLKLTNFERDLPLALNLGGRRELKVHYPFGLDPFIEAPIQEFYGLKGPPSIFGGKIPLALKLLGPHKRPIQVTKDLNGFWAKTYQEMKRELQRDYPKHYWPDNPLDAKPYLLKSHLPTK